MAILVGIQIIHGRQGGQAMLILTRRISESIIIETPGGISIEVAVLGVKGNQVRIGTQAPDNVSIMREELLDSADATSAP